MAACTKAMASWVVLLGIGIALSGCGHDGGGGGGSSTSSAPPSTTTVSTGGGGSSTSSAPPSTTTVSTGSPTSPTPKPARPPGAGNYVNYKVDGFKSISWGPFWLLDQSCIDTFDPKCAGPFANSDLAADWGEPMWSTVDGGRGDLRNIKDMGANTIRLYGNDPRMNKKKFFDYADALDIQVVEGLTGWIYNQGGGPNCASADPKARQESCFEAVKQSYSDNLVNGFKNENYYHNAISIINLANEPDFFGWDGSPENVGGLYMWAMITAFDGLLSAEKLHKVQPWKDGSLPRITVTWSFSKGLAGGVDTCAKLYGMKSEKECVPGLVFMLQFARAVEDPVTMTGYKPENDLSAAFKSRWINTVQLFVPASYAISAFIKPYMTYTELKDIPVVFTEWNPLTLSSGDVSNGDSLKDELEALQQASKSSDTSSFYGASYFQYQIAYQKGDPERKFGLFGLGDKVITNTHPWKISDDHDGSHALNCLTRAQSQDISDIVAAWGGKEPTSGLCDPSAAWSEAVEV